MWTWTKALWLAPVLGLSQCVVGESCSLDGDCGGEGLCWSGRCEPAMDRYWNVDVRRAEVGPLHPDGAPWDLDGSPPDLYAEFGLPDDSCLTSYVPQSDFPGWFESCDFYVPYDPYFFVELWDVDGATDELGATFDWVGSAAWVSLARTAGHQAAYQDPSGTATLWLRLTPR